MTLAGGRTGARPLVGRGRELAVLDRFLADMREWAAGLHIDGDPGIGKSTLWERGVYAAGEKPGRVLSYRAVRAEATYGYAGLADLFEPVLDLVADELPDHQRRALDAALLRREAPQQVEQRVVALAVLQLLRLLAAMGPVLVAIDDLQWLDEASARALAFASRRLDGEPVGVLVSRRVAAGEGIFELQRLLPEARVTRLRVGPLPAAELVEVVRSASPVPFPRAMLTRIAAQAAGNPFYALELARAATRGDAALSADVRALVSDRVGQLPATARRALFCASAMVTARISVIAAALGRTDGRVPSLARAEEAGVIEVGGGVVRFTHPLLASAVHASIPLNERRRLHRALARVAEDPEEVAVHRGQSAIGPDEQIADELERAARRAEMRGSPATSAELSARAAELTPFGYAERQLDRRLATAQYLAAAGDTAQALDALADIVRALGPGAGRARALHALAMVQWRSAGFQGAAPPLEQALTEAGEDPSLRGRILLDLARCYARADQRMRACDITAEAIALARQAGDNALVARGLSTLGRLRFLTGRGVGSDLFEQALSTVSVEVDPQTHIATRTDLAANLIGAYEIEDARTHLDIAHALVVARGDETRLAQLLAMYAELDVHAGHWQRALELSDAAVDAAARAEQVPAREQASRQRALVLARLGRVEEARALTVGATRPDIGPNGFVDNIENCALLGFIGLSLGELGPTVELLDGLQERTAAVELFDPGAYSFLPDLAEALIGLGRHAEARPHIEWLAERGGGLDRPWAIAVASRCQALLDAREGRPEAAFAGIERALAAHERLPVPFELARTLLVKGTIERQSRSKSPARQTLQAAVDAFDALGARLWAQSARTELARVGGRSPSPGKLTPTERSVADLVATGRSNEEVARALFMSAKTVEWNLTKVYRKLHVRSRAELAAMLSQRRA